MTRRARRLAQLGMLQLSLFPNEASDIAAFGIYKTVDTPEALAKLLEYLRGADRIALDTETSSTQATTAKLVGISLARFPGIAFYIPVGHSPDLHLGQQLELSLVQEGLGPVLQDPSITKVFHNAKYDIVVLQRHGLPVVGPIMDSMIAAWMIDPTERRVGLKEQVKRRLRLQMTSLDEVLSAGFGMEVVSVERATRYSSADADMTLRLMNVLEPIVQAQHEWLLFTKMEMQLIPVLTEVETYGILVDRPYLGRMAKEFKLRLGELEAEIYKLVGHEFNVRAPGQLADALFGTLKLPSAGRSTRVEVLRALRDSHPVIDLVLEYRQLAKLENTYVTVLPRMMDSEGRVHTSLNQTGTRTGRLSSSKPNLQQIPTRTDIGRRVRGAFIAPPDCVILSCDYTQIEPRILAHITQDPKLLAAFAAGIDVHTSAASELFGVPMSEVNYAQRTLAKRIYFGLMYGISNRGLAERTGLSPEEAQNFIDAYFDRFVRIKIYFQDTLKMARTQGYVRTLLGRRRYFPELIADRQVPDGIRRAAERAAINMPIQGTAADIMKLAMIGVSRELHRTGLHSHIVLQVHDELLLEVPLAELEITRALVIVAMEGAYKLDAPLKAHSSTGSSWLQAMQGEVTR